MTIPHFSKLVMLTAESMSLKSVEYTQDPEMHRAYSNTFQNEPYSGSYINSDFSDVLNFKVKEKDDTDYDSLYYYFDGKRLMGKSSLNNPIMTYGRP